MNGIKQGLALLLELLPARIAGEANWTIESISVRSCGRKIVEKVNDFNGADQLVGHPAKGRYASDAMERAT